MLWRERSNNFLVLSAQKFFIVAQYYNPMPTLKVKVACSKCGEKVEKTDSREVGKNTTGPIYECFPCFKKKRARQPGSFQENSVKYNLYCERCKYKFTSARKICPYCNSEQHLEASELTATDLLGL